MKKYLYICIGVFVIALAFGTYKIHTAPATNTAKFSQEQADISSTPFQDVFRAKVTEVLEKNVEQNSRLSRITETLKVVAQSGAEKSKELTVGYDDTLTNLKLQEVKTGDVIVVGKIQNAGETSYVLVDRYRLPYLAFVGLLFLALAILFGRTKGLTSIFGLAASMAILVWFIVPNLLAGKDPVLVTLVGAGIIALVSMFLAHGFNKRTVLATVSTLITLGLAEVLAYTFVNGLKILGNGSEEAFFLQAGYFGSINLQGLLLGGIIIGTLGVLNDITTAQAATVEELHAANETFSFKQLYIKGTSVGREHIASLINTLVLTYAGASLPLFLLLSINTKQLWVTLNSGAITEEIVRTLVGSIALILAVPITTALAAYYFHSEKDIVPLPEKSKDNYWEKAHDILNKK